MNAEKCKANIKIAKQENIDLLDTFLLEIDSTGFYHEFLLNMDESEVSCILDVQYSNKSGMEQNLCFKLKAKIIIKFTQVVHISFNNIRDFK